MSAVRSTAFERMDRMYGPQKRIYDLTRAYYLLGRDRMLAGIAPADGSVVLDIGCGTGRNLCQLAKLYPSVQLVGLDPCKPMLEVASANLTKQGLTERIALHRDIAESLPRLVADKVLPQPDHILFSYSLSIMPKPEAALSAALAVLRALGQIHIADFGSMQTLPGWFRKGMQAWLARFDVHYRPEVAKRLESAQGRCRIDSLYAGYAEILRFERTC